LITKGNEGLVASNREQFPPRLLAISYVFVTIAGKNLHPDSAGLRQLAEEVDG